MANVEMVIAYDIGMGLIVIGQCIIIIHCSSKTVTLENACPSC